MTAWQVQFILEKSDWNMVGMMVSDLFDAVTIKPVSDGDPNSAQQVALIFPEQPDEEILKAQLSYIFGAFNLDVPEMTVEALPDIDWLQHVYAQLRPIEAGRFFVHGSHVTESAPRDKIALLIEAATAFGTGEHPTTKGCLLAFDALLNEGKTPQNILDMGCGSGILAIASAKVLPGARILGVDIDANSVTVARNHARDNHVADQIDFIAGDGFRDAEVAKRAPYDLVFGNILAQPLIEMAADFCRVASGDLILSGFTLEQSPYVEKAYRAFGYDTVSRDNLGHDMIQKNMIDEWVTLWLRRK